MNTEDRVTWTTRPSRGRVTRYVGVITSFSETDGEEFADVSVPDGWIPMYFRVRTARLTPTTDREGTTMVNVEPEYPLVGSVWRRDLGTHVGALGECRSYAERRVERTSAADGTVTWCNLHSTNVWHTCTLATWRRWVAKAEREKP